LVAALTCRRGKEADLDSAGPGQQCIGPTGVLGQVGLELARAVDEGRGVDDEAFPGGHRAEHDAPVQRGAGL
jgi:hypothetical protein